MDGEGEQSATQWITLLHSRLASQQGGGPTVEIPQGAVAAVVSLNEFPQDIPPLWSEEPD